MFYNGQASVARDINRHGFDGLSGLLLQPLSELLERPVVRRSQK
jgi:hypothetical protein